MSGKKSDENQISKKSMISIASKTSISLLDALEKKFDDIKEYARIYVFDHTYTDTDIYNDLMKTTTKPKILSYVDSEFGKSKLTLNVDQQQTKTQIISNQLWRKVEEFSLETYLIQEAQNFVFNNEVESVSVQNNSKMVTYLSKKFAESLKCKYVKQMDSLVLEFCMKIELNQKIISYDDLIKKAKKYGQEYAFEQEFEQDTLNEEELR